MWELFKDQLIRVQDWHVPVRKKDKDGKKHMEDSEIRVEHADMLGHFEIKKKVMLGLLKSIAVDKFPGPDGIYLRLLREAREEMAAALTKIFTFSLATGEVLEN
eukprot:g38289.t1